MEKHWELRETYPADFAFAAEEYGRVAAQLLWNREIRAKDEIKAFFKTDLRSGLHDPFLFQDMAKAADLAVSHIKNRHKITVYGDYDADGVTAAALLIEILRILRADADVYIPHRVTEGYGLNQEAVKAIAADGTKLIITVDGGIRNSREAELAAELGLDVIITDHHPASSNQEERPACPLINPVLEDEPYPYKKLAGVGVAFKFASALIIRSKLNEDDKLKLRERLLDLVAIGTVADIVDILGENRVLVKAGLELINRTERPGLSELLKIAGLENSRGIDTWNIGFQIAPRLNAAGRMGRANAAFDLLLARDKDEAKALAAGLNASNIERQQQTEEITAAIEAQIGLESKSRIIIGVCPEGQCAEGSDSGQGVIGLVAGKIQNKYYLPALVITRDKKGFKGSGRSIPEFDLAKAVESCQELLLKFGGHPMACGFSLKEENLEKFKEKISGIAELALGRLDLKPMIKIEAELALKEITEDLMLALDRMAPFGPNNARPVFLSQGLKIVDVLRLGLNGQHLKLRLADGNSAPVSALAFNQAEKWQDYKIGDRVDAAYYLDRNEFNGRSEIQMKLADLRKSL